MVEIVVMWGMMALFFLAVSIGVLLVAGYITMHAYKKGARKAVAAIEAGFADATRGTTDISRTSLPMWTRALIRALRQQKRKQVSLWFPRSIEEIKEMTEVLPAHVIGLCRDMEKFRDAIAFELHRHEQAALTCAILCRQATQESLDATCANQEQLHALITEERFSMFVLQDERARVAKLKNALVASRVTPPSEANECLHRLMVQTRVLTECALGAARVTADKELLKTAWVSIDIRLSQLNHAFTFVAAWSAIMPDASDDWYEKHANAMVEDLQETLAGIAKIRDVARGTHHDEGSVSSSTEAFLLRCRLSHSALTEAEDTIRGLMTTLSDAVLPEKRGQETVH